MKILVALILLLFSFQIAAAQANNEILATLRERVELGKINQSVVVGTIDEKGVRFVSLGKTSQKAGARDADENTIFEIGSVTKVFTGTLLADAVQRGEVRLDDPITKFLPKTVTAPSLNGKEITLLDLVTHTSGLPRLPANFAPKNPRNPYADYTVEQMYDFLSNYKLTREPGAKSEYSNLGMGLLGHILSLRAGKSYEETVKTRILQPLGMNDTTIALAPTQKTRFAEGFDLNGDPAAAWDMPTLAGAGAFRSTAKDMAKFVSANINLEKSLSSVFTIMQKLSRDAGPETKTRLAWQILSKPAAEILWHNGGTGGFQSFIGFVPAQKRGIVVLTNSAESVDDIGLHFLDAKSPLRKIKPLVAVDEKILDEYVGSYELAPNVIFIITRQADKLFAQLSGQPNVRVFAASTNKFYYKIVDAQLTFNRGADGKIESLTLHQDGDQTAKKINKQ